jgi:alpha/beta superfamily hydrolase
MLAILFIILFIFGFLFLFFIYKFGLKFLKNKLYYFPYKEHIFEKPSEDIEDIYIPFKSKNIFGKTIEGKLHGWLFRPKSSEDNSLMFFCHGNSGNISYKIDLINKLIKSKTPFFIFDYKGFGKSEGETLINSTYEDTEICYKYLKEKMHIASNIVPVGESIGAFPASKLAINMGLKRLILIGGINSISMIINEKFPIKLLGLIVKGDLDVGSLLKDFNGKLMIIHSKTDEIVSFNNALKNREICGKDNVELIEASGSHNNMVYNINDIENFLN